MVNKEKTMTHHNKQFVVTQHRARDETIQPYQRPRPTKLMAKAAKSEGVANCKRPLDEISKQKRAHSESKREVL